MDDKNAEAILALLAGFDCVSVARIATDGRLIAARGFLAGLLSEDDATSGFREPAWATLAGSGAGDAPAYRGQLRIGSRRDGETVVNGAVWRVPSGLLVLAEREADDIEHLSKATVRLANELSTVRRELAEAKGDLTQREEQVRVMNFVDRITGLGNQRAFHQALAAEILRVGRYGGPLCLVLASIDGLEGIAKNLGEDRADDVLRCFARVVCNETRKTDQVCRVGPNRFMLMLTHTPPERAAGITERIRVAFAAATPGMVAATVTASFGHADWREGDNAATLADRVDLALKAAHAAGGDRVESA